MDLCGGPPRPTTSIMGGFLVRTPYSSNALMAFLLRLCLLVILCHYTAAA